MIRSPSWTRRSFLAGASAAFTLPVLASPSLGTEMPSLKVGSLRFGSVNWLLDTIVAEELPGKHGFELERLDLASNQATTVALQAREVDMIVSDWTWALRKRAEGDAVLFYPYSVSLGAVMVAADSPVKSLADLRGKKIGVAGGPLDKSWLVLRAHSREAMGDDLADVAEPVFGAPPLLSEQLKIGRIDAVLTFWNFAARLEAEGYHALVEMSDVMRELGIDPPSPLVGFVWHEDTMEEKREAVIRFFRAVDEANTILASSDAAWERLRPSMQLGTEAEFIPLRDAFRAGIPDKWGKAQLDATRHLFDVLAEMGGEELLGPATRFDPALFWTPEG